MCDWLIAYLWQTEQWWALSGLIEQHFWHLKITCPCCNPILWIISLVAFPLGTAPCKKLKLYMDEMDKNTKKKNWWLTGSVNMVLICDTNANTENARNNSKLNTLNIVCVPKVGMRMTKKVTNIAYIIRNQVSIAQIMPQISWIHQNRPEQQRLCISTSDVKPRRPELTSILKSSSRCCIWNGLVLLWLLKFIIINKLKHTEWIKTCSQFSTHKNSFVRW